jgi:hypothetical protein
VLCEQLEIALEIDAPKRNPGFAQPTPIHENTLVGQGLGRIVDERRQIPQAFARVR